MLRFRRPWGVMRALFSTNPQAGHRPLSPSQKERTLLLIKPDGVQRGLIGKIITRFENRGYKLQGIKMVNATREQAEAHYREHKDQAFFPRPCRFLCSGPVVAMVWEGEDIISVSRGMIGSTDPKKAASGTIRGDLGNHFRRNLIHGSDSEQTAKEEIKLWFTDEEIVHWDHSMANWVYELPNSPNNFEKGEKEDSHPGHLNGIPGVVQNDLPFQGKN
mmetsp:Transcript_6353/g.9756  ORF Transcript_6353/g.9756 Transcript_6353/m.9756 type:complete len:218 (-) Transcript_6353:106-759(-)